MTSRDVFDSPIIDLSADCPHTTSFMPPAGLKVFHHTEIHRPWTVSDRQTVAKLENLQNPVSVE